MKSGYKPLKVDHRDYTEKFGAVGVPELPVSLDSDAHLWMPDQDSTELTFSNPAMPFGCTDYTQADLTADEKKKLFNPILLENITHANARGGADIREALKAGKSLGWYSAFFNVRAQGSLDWFDTFRVALLLGKSEGRTLSVGTPWFSVFENPTNGILPTPDTFNTRGVSWHNYKITGWKMIGNQQYLIGKSWQGPNYGDHGLCYISRSLINSLMAISGAGAFFISQTAPQVVETVDLSWVQYVVSFVRMIGNNYILRPFGLV